MFAYCRNCVINNIDLWGELDVSTIEATKESLKELVLDQLNISPTGFDINLTERASEWNACIIRLGSQNAYSFIAGIMCTQYSIKYGEEFEFTNECVAYEFGFHADVFMNLSDYPGYARSPITYIRSRKSLCHSSSKVEIHTTDAEDWKQNVVFGYSRGRRKKRPLRVAVASRRKVMMTK